MPTVHRIGSIKIDVYSRDHLPPHFHAIYGDEEALIQIENLEIIEGDLPRTQYRKVYVWADNTDKKAILFDNFYRLNPRFKK